MELDDVVDQLCNHHQPDADALTRMKPIRESTKALIKTILTNCPAGPDRSAAIRKAREAMMTANASIVVKSYHVP